ncbi:hypothetical protein E2C01_005178 [Portunus trituberculatus]|uniref:Uncharacterized protein n=1 Tax=Portunus trituberculatus TaxID=210409 RepID=A0A5B7CSM8_PORTR|nr:hypothetical protein [Portunus trituberculatus]
MQVWRALSYASALPPPGLIKMTRPGHKVKLHRLTRHGQHLAPPIAALMKTSPPSLYHCLQIDELLTMKYAGDR